MQSRQLGVIKDFWAWSFASLFFKGKILWTLMEKAFKPQVVVVGAHITLFGHLSMSSMVLDSLLPAYFVVIFCGPKGWLCIKTPATPAPTRLAPTTCKTLPHVDAQFLHFFKGSGKCGCVLAFLLCYIATLFLGFCSIFFSLPPSFYRPGFTNRFFNHPYRLPTTSPAADLSRDLLTPPTLALFINYWFLATSMVLWQCLVCFKTFEQK